MRKELLGSMALVLASAVMASLMLSGIVAGPAPQPPVLFDVNVQNTPLPVEVTNPTGVPIATNHTRVGVGFGGTGTDYEIEKRGSSSEVVIDDKTVVFTGGSATGHLVFTCDNGIGSVPAAGSVEVTTADGTHRFPLPLNSLYRVEHVTGITVHAWVYRPYLPGSATYASEVQAVVFWYIEE